jgi:hypothetical protein
LSNRRRAPACRAGCRSLGDSSQRTSALARVRGDPLPRRHAHPERAADFPESRGQQGAADRQPGSVWVQAARPKAAGRCSRRGIAVRLLLLRECGDLDCSRRPARSGRPTAAQAGSAAHRRIRGPPRTRFPQQQRRASRSSAGRHVRLVHSRSRRSVGESVAFTRAVERCWPDATFASRLYEEGPAVK